MRQLRRWPGAIAAGAFATLLLGGCAGSLDHVRNICTDVTAGTDMLAPYDPAEPLTALQYAIGRFALIDRAVAAARESGIPGPDGPQLERTWLDAASASMADWDVRIEALRQAVNRDDPAATRARLSRAVAIGTENVDTDALRARGLSACADAFTPPAVPGAPVG